MAEQAPNYIFVVGCGHSGTSLLAAMLGAHSRIYSIAQETRLFRLGLTPDDIRAKLESLAAERPKQDVAYICEKTPRHIHASKQMWEVFPDAKIVAIIRDPRDVVSSLKRRLGNIDPCIGRWRGDNAKLRSLALDSRAYLVKFENLVLAPNDTLALLCAFLNLAYDPAMLDYWKDDREWFGANILEPQVKDGINRTLHRMLRDWQVHQPIMADKVGAYRKHLSQAEVEAINNRLARLASRFGYDLVV